MGTGLIVNESVVVRTLVVVVLLLTLSGSKAVAQSGDDVSQCFELLFKQNNFDAVYYQHKVAEDNCFFIVENEPIRGLLKEYLDDVDVIQLANGSVVSIDGQGTLFVWGVKYYLKICSAILMGDRFTFIFQEIEFDGFSETVSRQRKAEFVKGTNWSLVNYTDVD